MCRHRKKEVVAQEVYGYNHPDGLQELHINNQINNLQYFRLPRWCTWGLSSSVMFTGIGQQVVTDVLGHTLPTFKGQAVKDQPLKTGLMSCPAASVTNHHQTLHNHPENQRPQINYLFQLVCCLNMYYFYTLLHCFYIQWRNNTMAKIFQQLYFP